MIAAETLWDDLIFSAARHDDPGGADLIQMLPPQFELRAALDWQRWMVTFATVLWKLAHAEPPPPATMAEQILAAVLVHAAREQAEEWHTGGLLGEETPPQLHRLDDWLGRYLDDLDHEVLYDPAQDGIDDESTNYFYGFGRMDYDGMFADFSELGRRHRGSGHPLAPLHMTEREADEEAHVRAAVNALSAQVARAALVGEQVVQPSVTPANPPLTAFRISRRLGVSLEWDVSGVLRILDPGEPDALELWLEEHGDE